MNKRVWRIAVAAVTLITVNLAYAHYNPAAATMAGCGDICDSSSSCTTSCYYCLPNPIWFPGTCVS